MTENRKSKSQLPIQGKQLIFSAVAALILLSWTSSTNNALARRCPDGSVPDANGNCPSTSEQLPTVAGPPRLSGETTRQQPNLTPEPPTEEPAPTPEPPTEEPTPTCDPTVQSCTEETNPTPEPPTLTTTEKSTMQTCPNGTLAADGKCLTSIYSPFVAVIIIIVAIIVVIIVSKLRRRNRLIVPPISDSYEMRRTYESIVEIETEGGLE